MNARERRLVESACKLRNEVAGLVGAFERGIRPVVGNLNVNALKSRLDRINCALDAYPDIMGCGHDKSAVMSSDEGTHYCGDCAKVMEADDGDIG